MTAYATSADLAGYAGFTPAHITATATATVEEGAVTALVIGAGGGSGYVVSPSVLIGAPETGVRATATAAVANGVVTLLTLTSGGSGYGAEPPAVTIDPPADLSRLLERASELIDDHCRTARYDVDDDDLPTDEGVAAALRDATCAQVEFWLAGDEEDDVLGPLKAIKIGSVSAEPAEPLVLAPRAARILRDAHLYSGEPVVL
jgi:hypothetical protein